MALISALAHIYSLLCTEYLSGCYSHQQENRPELTCIKKISVCWMRRLLSGRPANVSSRADSIEPLAPRSFLSPPCEYYGFVVSDNDLLEMELDRKSTLEELDEQQSCLPPVGRKFAINECVSPSACRRPAALE